MTRRASGKRCLLKNRHSRRRWRPWQHKASQRWWRPWSWRAWWKKRPWMRRWTTRLRLKWENGWLGWDDGSRRLGWPMGWLRLHGFPIVTDGSEIEQMILLWGILIESGIITIVILDIGVSRITENVLKKFENLRNFRFKKRWLISMRRCWKIPSLHWLTTMILRRSYTPSSKLRTSTWLMRVRWFCEGPWISKKYDQVIR